MTSLFQTFRQRNNGTMPQHVVVYRDGVGDGQFNEVLDRELPCIQNALAAMVTIIISAYLTPNREPIPQKFQSSFVKRDTTLAWFTRTPLTVLLTSALVSVLIHQEGRSLSRVLPSMNFI